jgi:hypothetical protein
MKRTTCAVLCLATLALPPAFAQQPPPPGVPAQPPSPPGPGPGPIQPGAPPPSPPAYTQRLQNIITRASAEPVPEPHLTKFNLDFPGGTPRQLVAAIEKAMSRPLNAIVPDEFADTKLPAVKMTGVDVPQLFSALRLASLKSEAYQQPGYGSYQIHQTNCGFKTEGKPSDDAIWYFFVEKPVLPPAPQVYKVCRYYPLTPLLDRGATVGDITSAIETGWKMLGDSSPPTISFHKDTKLLIAVGEPNKLETIDAVLKALPASLKPEPGPRDGPPPPSRRMRSPEKTDSEK